MSSASRRLGWTGLVLLAAFACAPAATPQTQGGAEVVIDRLIAGLDSPYTDRQLYLKTRLTNLDTVHVRPLLTALSAARAGADSLFVPALRDWLDAAEHLDTAHRAAAYLVADHVLVASWEALRLWDRRQQEMRNRLAALGARSFFYEPGGRYRTAGSWEDEALRLDSLGAVGQYVLLRRIPHACWYSRTDAPFRWVIAMGERLLAHAATPTATASIHYYLGEAHRDIVALASGVQAAEQEASKYKDEAGAARTRAIEHYRASLALDSTSLRSAAARKEMDRLVAGLPPTEIRFYCFGGD